MRFQDYILHPHVRFCLLTLHHFFVSAHSIEFPELLLVEHLFHVVGGLFLFLEIDLHGSVLTELFGVFAQLVDIIRRNTHALILVEEVFSWLLCVFGNYLEFVSAFRLLLIPQNPVVVLQGKDLGVGLLLHHKLRMRPFHFW